MMEPETPSKTPLRRVKLLSAETVEKIAAGEVIERPASVVKELVENSIDAGSRQIRIEIRRAGLELIRVADDGCGMSAEDAQLAILPHATSKIESSKDLYRIQSLGFRGEALASIAAVSQFSLESSTDGREGIQIEVQGGAVRPPAPCGRDRGTTMTVSELFFNTPARKKFLRSERAEIGRILETIEEIALAFPRIGFAVRHNGREALDLPPASGYEERLASVWGKGLLEQSVTVLHSADGIGVQAFLGHPQAAAVTSRDQRIWVNGRAISDRRLQSVVRRAYGTLLPRDRYARFAMFLQIDPEQIDVNVHPTKREIRFSQESRVLDVIYSQVSKALRIGEFAAASFSSGPPAPNPAQVDESPQTTLDFVRETPPQYSASAGRGNPNTDSRGPHDLSQGLKKGPAMETATGFAAGQSGAPEPPAPSADHSAGPGPQGAGPEMGANYFQLHSLYILTPIKNGLLLIDQHAAHERILYERALDELKRPSGASQQLLFPVLVELRVLEYEMVESMLESFARLGFDIKPFGGTSISISGIPPSVSINAAEMTVRDMIGQLLSADDRSETDDRIAKSFACGAAIKAGQELKLEEMVSLVDMLFSTRNPYTCPHGRPTLVRMPLDEIAKRFLR